MSCQYNFSQFSVTGDCENNSSGGFTLYLSSTSEPMSITWLLPNPYPPGIGGPQVETPIYNGTYTYLGIPAGTVMSRLHRGRKLLRVLLADYAKNRGFGGSDGM